MGYARVRLTEIRQIVRRKAAKIRVCRNCGHDIDYSVNACCVEKRQSRGKARRKK